MSTDDVTDEWILRQLQGDLFEQYLDRSAAQIPDTFVPSAKGVAVVGSRLLMLVHPRAGYRANRAHNWVGSVREGFFFMLFQTPTERGTLPYKLSVRRYGKLWAIERELLGENSPEVLSFDILPTPIFHPRQRAAIPIAMFCHPTPREEANCLQWVPIAA